MTLINVQSIVDISHNFWCLLRWWVSLQDRNIRSFCLYHCQPCNLEGHQTSRYNQSAPGSGWVKLSWFMLVFGRFAGLWVAPENCKLLMLSIPVGILGKLNKSKTSRYSSSFTAGVLTRVWWLDLTSRGWFVIRRSRSYAHLSKLSFIGQEQGFITFAYQTKSEW